MATTTTTKKAAPAPAPAAARAKPASWMDNLDEFSATARGTVFKPKTTLFKFSTAGKGTGQALAVVVNAKIRADEDAARKVLVRIPAELDARLKEKTSGPVTVALVALAEWALEQLDERREILTIENK